MRRGYTLPYGERQIGFLMAKSKTTHVGYRDSKTGRFVTAEVAKRRPATTQKESVPNPGRGDTGRAKRESVHGGDRSAIHTPKARSIKPDSFTAKQGRAAIRAVIRKRLGVAV